MSKKSYYGEQDPAAEALEQTTPPAEEGVTLTDPTDPPVPDATLPGEEPEKPRIPERRDVVLPVGETYTDIIQQIVEELKIDGRPSAVNCLYHLGAAKQLVMIHEGMGPPEVVVLRDGKDSERPKAEPKAEVKS